MKGSTIKKLYDKFIEDDNAYSLCLFINTRKCYYISKKDKVIISSSEIIINDKIGIETSIIKAIER